MEQPKTSHYHGFTLRKCYCGYPEMRWLIYYGWTCHGSAKTLYTARRKCDTLISNFAI